jgi:hypothetical protein
MNVEGILVSPTLKQDHPVRVDDAAICLELFAAWLFHDLVAARPKRLRKFLTFSGRGSECDDEPDRHPLFLLGANSLRSRDVA